jgi:hypothetical protein
MCTGYEECAWVRQVRASAFRGGVLSMFEFPLMRAAILAAVLALATVASAQAQLVPHQRADGLWVCPNDERRIIVNGDWRIACFTNVPTISMDEFKALQAAGPRSADAGGKR